MGKIKPIETVYKGYRFRSRLEARWAVFFDSLSIPYVYEPEGLNIGGVYYLPDFYLPDCNQFFEVKGVMSELDEKKIDALIKAGYSVTISYDNGFFRSCDNWSYPGDKHFELTTCYSQLCRCTTCKKYWFMGNLGTWQCQCCGGYDGDSGFEIIMECDKTEQTWLSKTELWDVAKQARFEDSPKKLAMIKVQERADRLLSRLDN